MGGLNPGDYIERTGRAEATICGYPTVAAGEKPTKHMSADAFVMVSSLDDKRRLTPSAQILSTCSRRAAA